MDVYITQLRSHAEKAGIMKREIKKRINLFPVYVQRYRNSLRTTMSDDLYEYITDNVLDEMHDEFENSLKVLFYSTKRQVDRVISNSNLSSAIADLTMIYLIASLERGVMFGIVIKSTKCQTSRCFPFTTHMSLQFGSVPCVC